MNDQQLTRYLAATHQGEEATLDDIHSLGCSGDRGCGCEVSVAAQREWNKDVDHLIAFDRAVDADPASMEATGLRSVVAVMVNTRQR